MPNMGEPAAAILEAFAVDREARRLEREEIAAMVEAHGCQCKTWRYRDPSSKHDAWCPVALAAAIRARW